MAAAARSRATSRRSRPWRHPRGGVPPLRPCAPAYPCDATGRPAAPRTAPAASNSLVARSTTSCIFSTRARSASPSPSSIQVLPVSAMALSSCRAGAGGGGRSPCRAAPRATPGPAVWSAGPGSRCSDARPDDVVEQQAEQVDRVAVPSSARRGAAIRSELAQLRQHVLLDVGQLRCTRRPPSIIGAAGRFCAPSTDCRSRRWRYGRGGWRAGGAPEGGAADGQQFAQGGEHVGVAAVAGGNQIAAAGATGGVAGRVVLGPVSRGRVSARAVGAAVSAGSAPSSLRWRAHRGPAGCPVRGRCSTTCRWRGMCFSTRWSFQAAYSTPSSATMTWRSNRR